VTFTAEVRNTSDGAVMSLAGDLNALAAESFEAAGERALAGPPAELVLDFTETTFVNSTGIALIVGLLGRARDRRILVIGRGLDDHHRHIFEITRLSDFLRIEEPDEPEPASDTAGRPADTTETTTGGSHG
jgi:anti-sigma B factor antagonist